MLRKLALVLALVCVAALTALPARAVSGTLSGKKVALDPGHSEAPGENGTANEGCTSTGYCETVLEKDLNWDVVAETRVKLEALGAQVLVTRGQHEYVDRPTRYQRANAFGAQVLISVHHNGSADPTANYTISYYTQKSDQKIATIAQACLVSYLHFRDLGISRSGFGMTVKPRMPSTLTESWFLTNDVLANRLVEEKQVAVVVTEDWRDYDSDSLVDLEAAALTDAIERYLTNRPACSG